MLELPAWGGATDAAIRVRRPVDAGPAQEVWYRLPAVLALSDVLGEGLESRIGARRGPMGAPRPTGRAAPSGFTVTGRERANLAGQSQKQRQRTGQRTASGPISEFSERV